MIRFALNCAKCKFCALSYFLNMFNFEHLEGIDLSKFDRVYDSVSGGHTPTFVDVVLVPIISGDNIFLRNYPLYSYVYQPDPDMDSEIVYCVPYCGQMVDVISITHNLYLGDGYIGG